MLIQQRLDEMTMRYTDARASVARFLLEQRAAVNHLSMQQVADATYTSKATLVRVAKSMSFAGWTDLVKHYVEEVYYLESQFRHADVNIPFEKGDSTDDIIHKVGSVMTESIADTAELLTARQMEKAARLLKAADRISIFCLPPNAFLAELFCRKMLLIGKAVELFDQSDQMFHAATLSEKDCAILISYSGSNEKRTPMRSLKWLKKNHVPIIAITGAGENVLRKHADVTFTMSSMEQPYSKIATFATEESIGFLLNALYSCYFAMDYEKNLSYKLEIASLVEQKRYLREEK